MSASSLIFTRLANEVRDDNAVIVKSYRKEHSHDIQHGTLVPKLMSRYDAEKSVFDEVDSILFQRGFGGSSRIDAHTSLGSWKTSAMKSRVGSSGGRSMKSENEKLKARANEMRHLTDRWHKGPVAVGQPKILAPLKMKNGENITHHKAKNVQRQTLRLMHNMERVGEISRRHATIRRRIMEDAQNTGKDHVLKSLEAYLPETEEIRAEKLMLSLIISNCKARVKFIPLKDIPVPMSDDTGHESSDIREKRKLLRRLDALWAILQPPDAVKLEFKFIIKDMGDDNAFDDRGRLNHLSVMGMEDLYQHISILETLRRVFDSCVEESVNPYCESEALLAPIVDMSTEVGFKRITKGLREDIYAWIHRIMDALVQKIRHIIEIWADYRDKCSDGFGVQFFENLSEEINAFLPDRLPDFAIMSRSRATSAATDDASFGSHSLDESFVQTKNPARALPFKESRKPKRNTRAPKTVPKATVDTIPNTRANSSEDKRDENENDTLATDRSRSLNSIVDGPPAVKTRQQVLLDDINRTKLKHTIDVGELMKYYTKKPNVRKSFKAEVKAAEEAAAAEALAAEIAAKKRETLTMVAESESEGPLIATSFRFRAPKPPMLSTTTFSFSSGEFESVKL